MKRTNKDDIEYIEIASKGKEDWQALIDRMLTQEQLAVDAQINSNN